MYKLVTTAAVALALTFAGAANADDHRSGEGAMPHFEQALSKLPEAKAETFRASLKQAHDQHAPIYEQTHKLHDELKTILTAPTFDKDAFIAKHKQLQGLYDQMRAHMTEAFADAAAKLSLEERKTLADSMHRPGAGSRGEHGKRKP